VAITLAALELEFEHRDWSVGRDFDRIREYSPLGRVPVLVLDSGEALTESGLILDYLDRRVGPARALAPRAPEDHLAMLRLMAFATGAVEKGLQIVAERVFRPAEYRYGPYIERCRLQMRGALTELDRALAAAPEREWLFGGALSHADITLACYTTYVHEAVPESLAAYPALAARVARYEALPLFAKYHLPFDAPMPQ
jgi:glutathione S-transferase